MTAKSKYRLVLVAIIVAAGIVGFIVWQKSASPVKRLPAAQVVPGAIAPTIPPVSDCLLPGPAPVPPDGDTADDAEMKLEHIIIQNFVLSLEAYQACRNTEIDHAGASVSEKQKQAWVDDGNEAVDQANALANAFSVQLKKFKAHHPEH